MFSRFGQAIVTLIFALLCFISPANSREMKTDDHKVTVLLAMPFREDVPFDPNGMWYTPEYTDYIRTLLPPEKYSVTGYFVSLKTIPKFVNDMEELYKKEPSLRILNMCDGGEWDGYPGISVLTEWEKRPISKLVAITGSNAEFIYNSDDKKRMNDHLRNAKLNALPEALIPSQELSRTNVDALLEKENLTNSWPLFCKLNIGAAALSIGPNSVCHNSDELKTQLTKMAAQYPTSDLLIQPYLPGPEYTILVIGDKVYAGVRRDFHNTENLMLEDYLSADSNVEEEISFHPMTQAAGDVALKAIKAIPGRAHYTRVDIRDDGKGNLFVIDINDRPGFGATSTVKCMLDFNQKSDKEFLEQIVLTAPRS